MAEYDAQKQIRINHGIRTRTTHQLWKPEFDGLHWVRDVAPLCGIGLPDPIPRRLPARVETEWVHEFVDGHAVSYPRDSPDGQRVAVALTTQRVRSKVAADRADRTVRTEERRVANFRKEVRRGRGDDFDPATGLYRRTCPAPRPLFPNQTCGAEFWGPKNQKCCSPTCATRLRRAVKAVAKGSDAPGDISTDIRMPLPGAPRAISDVAAPILAAPPIAGEQTAS